MRMIELAYRNLTVHVRFDSDKGEPQGIYTGSGRLKGGKYDAEPADEIFSAGAHEEINDLAKEVLAQILEDEAADRQDQIDRCFDTPYRMAA